MHAELNRESVTVARCTIEPLMRAEGLRGIPREKPRKTTLGEGAETERPEGKSKRDIIRCLKRYVIQEVYHLVKTDPHTGEIRS
ncbi:IS3 family transposase [uncultured Corynebacterium sp.]|uniref:IS3 family transposase n=1 Tax=uncultured Corynebacterium sp. TaxID=159447 RepID=UPI0037DCEF2A